MAKNNITSPRPVVRDPYPRIAFDRSFAMEAARRNIEIIVWYRRLINATLALVVAAGLFSLLAVGFAVLQPPPKLYGSALDGALRQIDYVRKPGDPRLVDYRNALQMEAASLRETGVKRSVGLPGGAQPNGTPGAPLDPNITPGGAPAASVLSK